MIAFKFLGAAARGPFSEQAWPLPDGSAPGAWLQAADGSLLPCVNGVHACSADDLPYWINDELWRVELDGEQLNGPESVIARRGRLLAKVDAWNNVAAERFARFCVARMQAYLAGLTAPSAEVQEHGAQYLATAQSTLDSGAHAVTAYVSAMAFILLADSADRAFRAERLVQARELAHILGL